jgi:futalosine hydrolase
MKILLISATYNEIEGVVKTLKNLKCLEKGFFRGFADSKLIDILISGVGSVATTASLSGRLELTRYDLVLNVGICGSFRRELTIGTVVNIVSEIWGDLGVEDHGDFLDLFDLGVLKNGEKPFTGTELINPGNAYSKYFSDFTRVKGLTVNKAHGETDTIAKCIKKYNPEVESMESAAVFSACISRGINFQCLRSISNFVEPRNRSAWDIETALQNLSIEINRIISVIRK